MINSIERNGNIFITDVRAERLFREAEDDFFYFNKIDSAIEKIEKALVFSPGMIKALLMRANIAVIEGNIDLALEFYKRAEGFAPQNVKVLAGLANIYEMNNENTKAFEYIEKALNIGVSQYSPLNKALLDLKFTVLIKQKKYLEAQKIINKSRYVLSEEDFRELQSNNLSVLKQKLLLKKKLEKTNLKVIK